MNFESLMTAVGLVLILEGIMPFVSPGRWRDLFLQVAQLGDDQIRFMGLGFLLLGVLLLSLF